MGGEEVTCFIQSVLTCDIAALSPFPSISGFVSRAVFERNTFFNLIHEYFQGNTKLENLVKTVVN